MLVPLPASQKKAQSPPSSLLFDSDDEDFEPSPVAGPQAALYNGAPSQRGDSLRTDSNNSLPETVNDAPSRDIEGSSNHHPFRPQSLCA
ncbi:hypothetical protein MTO96_045067 [Rhipicephalus appendiculatus]